MSCRLLPISEFENMAPIWDQLNFDSYKNPLLESRFTRLTLQHFGSGKERLLVCGPEQKPDAIAIIKPARLGCWTTFQPSQSPLGAFIIRPRKNVTEICGEMVKALPFGGLILSITQQDPEILPRPTSDQRIRTIDYVATARVPIKQSFSEYWAERGRNLRNNMKRQKRRLDREGTSLSLMTESQPSAIANVISQYGELESAGWKSALGTAIRSDNMQGRFYTDLLEEYAKTGNTKVFLYLYNNRLSAVDLCIHNHKTLIILKTTYDESITASSPALLMRYEYFSKLFEERVVENIEFYGKIMDWHTKWTDHSRTMYHINIYRNRILACLHSIT